jgi:hypothetical protein
VIVSQLLLLSKLVIMQLILRLGEAHRLGIIVAFELIAILLIIVGA